MNELDDATIERPANGATTPLGARVRTVLVTGANQGIGRAIATALVGGSHRVLFAARSLADATEAANAARVAGHGRAKLGVGGHGLGHREKVYYDLEGPNVEGTSAGEAIGVELPLDDPAEAGRRVRAIEREHGPIDVLINNAGTLHPGRADEVDVDEVRRSIDVNAMSPFALIGALGPGMRERGWGRIVNVSSGWGSFDEGLSGPAAYAISKSTLNAVTVSFAQALGYGVKVNAACPGWVRTRMGGEAAHRSPAEGADTPVWLTTLPDDGPTGGFFRDRRLIDW